MRKVLVLASGGLDSTVVVALYKNLGYDVHLLYLPYGNINEKAETERLLKIREKFGIPAENTLVVKLNLNYSNSSCIHKDGTNPYVEMRNLIFLSYAISVAEAKGIDLVAVGFISVPAGYPDTTEQFIHDINNLALNASGIGVVAPLHHLDKIGVYKLGKKLGVNLLDTFSCNVSNDKPCGECYDCLDIKNIIKKVGVPDQDNPFIQWRQ